MSLSTLLHRRAGMAVRVNDTLCTFVDGTIVARADNWRPLHGNADMCHARGHTSYCGELVPVYDLASILGSPPSASFQIAIVKMAIGHIAFLIDEFIGSTSAKGEEVRLSQLEIFRHEYLAA
ncbi:MAG: chemotaxis protein CheW [Rhizobium sp.]|nr:MAG: chemotaxis protein CheW [Rhizobium sp.]